MRKKNRSRGPICDMKTSAYSYIVEYPIRKEMNRLNSFVLKDFLNILVCFQGAEKIKDKWQPCMISMSVCKPPIYYLTSEKHPYLSR